MQVSDKVLAVNFPLLPNIENSRNFLLHFVFPHQSRRFLKGRAPTVHELIIPPLAVLDDIVGQVEERQSTLDFH